MRGRVFIWPLLAVLGALPAAPAVRAMVPGDLLDLRTVRSEDLSPDGRWLLYTLSSWDEAAGAHRATLYRRDLETGDDLLIFTPEDRARAPVWRSDGEAIAYLKDTDAGTEAWLMARDGGQRRRVGEPAAYGTLHWSPQGDALAWIAAAELDGYPGESGVRWVDDELGYRHLGQGERGGALGQLFVLELTADPGQPRRLLHEPLDVRSCAWSPDGRQLVLAAKARADLGRTLNEDLWLVGRAGGPLTRLTTNPGADSTPRWQADGTIAYVRSDDPLWESAPRSIAVLDPAVGDADLLAAYTHDQMFWTWTAADGAFYVLGAERGAIELIRLGPDRPLALTAAGCGLRRVRVAGGRAVLDGGSLTLPGGIFVVDLGGDGAWPRDAELIIDPNARWRQQVGLIEPEPFAVTVDGARIEGWFFKPPDPQPGQRVPTVLSIHGGPEWMYGGSFLPEFHILPHYGYAVIAANPVGSTGYGFAFQAAIRGDWVERPAREVLACVDAAIEAGWADPGRLAVIGGSYGGHLGAALTTQTDRFAAAALDRMYPDPSTFWGTTDEKWFPEWEFGGRPFDPEAQQTYRRNSPWELVDRVSTPTLVSHGLRDHRCPVQGAEMWFAALRSRGVPTRLIRFVDEGHGIRGPRNLVFYHDQLLAWFDEHVLGPSAEDAQGHE